MMTLTSWRQVLGVDRFRQHLTMMILIYCMVEDRFLKVKWRSRKKKTLAMNIARLVTPGNRVDRKEGLVQGKDRSHSTFRMGGNYD